MKLFCYELMDLASNGPAIATLFRENMDEIVSTMAAKTEEVGGGHLEQTQVYVRVCVQACYICGPEPSW